MNILAIETSCDETAVAVVENGIKVLSSQVASSSKMHEKWGGILPEQAAREQLTSMIPVLSESITLLCSHNFKKKNNLKFLKYLKHHIDAVAVTVGPGLIGSLLVGVETAKTISYLTRKPIIPVNHVLAHMYANFVVESDEKISNLKSQISINNQIENNNIKFPAISLVVSGGHTELYLMRNIKTIKWLGGTVDDAAGEAFDKTARFLGLGTGGGPAIELVAKKAGTKNKKSFSLAQDRQKTKIVLPRPMINDDTLNFSFSGLKTAVIREWDKYQSYLKSDLKDSQDLILSAFAFEIQEAICDVLLAKTLKAAQKHKAKSILISGGVASNMRLREKFKLQLTSNNLQLFAPPKSMCTDNAIYVGSYAYFRGEKTIWSEVVAKPSLSVEVLK